MEQHSTILQQTRLENLLRHFDIKDFIQFLAKEKFLSRSEVTSIPNSKQEAIHYIASRDKFHSQFLQVFEQYRICVREDVTVALAEISMRGISKLSIAKHNKRLPHAANFETDSFSSSSFSDDSDNGVNAYSQEIPNDSSECSGLLPDTGYYTQSNTSQSLSDTTYQLSSQKISEQLQRRPEKTKKVYKKITKNYTKNYFIDSTNGCGKQPPLSFLEESRTKACATEGYGQLHSPVYEEIGKFKKALQSCNHELIVCMNVQSMLPYLQQEALLTTNEYEKLTQAVKTPSEQNQYLLGILPTKGERACERFVKCLSLANEHSGHAHLVKLLSSLSV